MSHQSNIQRRRGFTLVEILTAVAVISILVGMAFLGYQYVSRNTREKQGQVAMEIAKSLLAEYEHSGGKMDVKRFYEPLKKDGSKGPINFFVNEDPPAQVHAPTQMRQDEANRFGLEALATHRFLRAAASIPECAKLLANLPEAARVYPEYQSGMTYLYGDELMRDGLFYRVTGSETTTTSPPPKGTPPTGGWTQAPQITPLVMDGDKNLLILITPSGLSKVTQGGIANWRITSVRPIKPTDPDYTGPNALVGKPFFASPGPDGDFVTGDDNVYSSQR